MLLLTTGYMKKPSASNRILAALLDILIGISFCLLTLIPTIVCFANASMESTQINIVALLISSFLSGSLSLGILIIYFVILPVHFDGQTFGKRFFSIKCQKKDGSKVDYKSMIIRSLFRILVAFATFGLSIIVDLITLISSKDHLTFYDILASIVVVDASHN